MSAGIQRFVITDEIEGCGEWRFIEARKRHKSAAELYRQIFEDLGVPLLGGYEEIECTKEEFEAGYDRELGIDVVLTFENRTTSTLQEKFLFTPFRTVTVEYMQDWRQGIKGDWFTMKAQYYFVGYDRQDVLSFEEWVLLNWPATQLATAMGQIPWDIRQNDHDGARASFKYTEFDNLPNHVIVAKQLL